MYMKPVLEFDGVSGDLGLCVLVIIVLFRNCVCMCAGHVCVWWTSL